MTERAIHVAVADLLARNARAGVVWWHTPNGGSRNRIEAARMKALGVKAGVPDLLLLIDGTLHALELKAAKGRVSAEQTAMLSSLSAAGAIVGVARSVSDSVEILKKWNAFARPIRVAA